MKYLIFDTETTGLPKTRKEAKEGPNNWPHIVSISWVIMDDKNTIHKKRSYIVKPRWEIPEESTKIHGITQQHAFWIGKDLKVVMDEFLAEEYDILIAHNLHFDYNVLVNTILWDLGMNLDFQKKKFCTMIASRNLCKLPSQYGNGYKAPKLKELYKHVFGRNPIEENLHGSEYDTEILVEILQNSSDMRHLLTERVVNHYGGQKDTNGVLQL